MKSVETLRDNFSHVWYASYGSNLSEDRFMVYIRGGQAPGTNYEYPGCTDTTSPVGDISTDLPFSLYFAKESKVWGGGMAFVTHDQVWGPSKSRAYLIKTSQFEEVVGQENHLKGGVPIDYEKVKTAGKLALPSPLDEGNYGQILYGGEYEGAPIFTFTNRAGHQESTRPSIRYLRMIASGLRQAHNMDAEAAASYLYDKPGLIDVYTRNELATLLDQAA